MNQAVQQQDSAGQQLELIYEKIIAVNKFMTRIDMKPGFSEDDLALIRWAFSVNEKNTV